MAMAFHVSMQSLYLLGENMPESFTDKAPYTLISHTWYYFLIGDVKSFCTYLDRLYVKLPEIYERHRQFFQHALLMPALDFRRPLLGMRSLITPETAGQIPESGVKTTSLTENMPFIHRSHRDYSDFATDIEGNLETAGQIFAVMLQGDFACGVAALGAMLYFEKNMLKKAEENALQAVAALRPSTVAELRFSVDVTLATILFAVGQVTAAKEKFAQMDTNIAEQDAAYLLPNFKAVETKLLLLDGNKKAASDWLENYFVTQPEQLELYKICQHFTTARAYIVLGKRGGHALHRPTRKIGRGFSQTAGHCRRDRITSSRRVAHGQAEGGAGHTGESSAFHAGIWLYTDRRGGRCGGAANSAKSLSAG